jgi:hypothetical protein
MRLFSFCSALSFASVSLQAFAAPPSIWPTDVRPRACVKQAETVLRTYQWRGGYRLLTASGGEFRRPLRNLGSWVDLRIPDSGSAIVMEIAPDKIRRRSWDAKCREILTEEAPAPFYSDLRTGSWKDSDLKGLIGRLEREKKPGAVVTVWSPDFVHSIEALPDLAQAAAREGLEFIALRDPRSTIRTAVEFLNASRAWYLEKQKSDSAASPFPPVAADLTLGSFEIFRLNGFDHFPVSFLVTPKGVVETPLPGVLPLVRAREFLRELLSSAPSPIHMARNQAPTARIPALEPPARNESGAVCTQAFTYFPLRGDWVRRDENGRVALGVYNRMSPDGLYVLRSNSGPGVANVTILRLNRETKSVDLFETALSGEAFAVQGTWRYVVDIDGSHYRLRDLLKDQRRAKRQFRAGVTGFYATAAELPGGRASEHSIRSLSWPSPQVDPSAGSGQSDGGPLYNTTVKVGVDSRGEARDQGSNGQRYLCSNVRNSEGHAYTLPMISADGTEFAARPLFPRDRLDGIRIYRIGDNAEDCTLLDRLDYASSKVVFGFPKPGQKAPVVFYQTAGGTHGVHFHDRNLGKTFAVRDPDRIVWTDGYPGFTRDGRLVYGARWKAGEVEEAGFVIADPHQAPDLQAFRKANPNLGIPECITEAEVRKMESEQRTIYGF